MKRFWILFFLSALSWFSYAGVPLLQDHLSAPETQWNVGKHEFKDGKFYLIASSDQLYAGTIMASKALFPLPDEDSSFLFFSFQLENITEWKKHANGGSLRVFIFPSGETGFCDPTILKNNLHVLLEKYAEKDIKLTFYLKHDGMLNYGKELYSATIPPESLPLTIGLWFNRSAFRLDFDHEVLTNSGSVSGQLPLSNLPAWRNPLRAAFRIVNHAEQTTSAAIFDDVMIKQTDGYKNN